MKRRNRLLILILAVNHGCFYSSVDANPKSADSGEENSKVSLGLMVPNSSALTFDFGPLLARGQVLKHAFTLTNDFESARAYY